MSAPALSASEERPRGTSTLIFWLRQGNSSRKERSGGASCPSDVPRVDDEYEIQRLRKSKVKRKAEASTGDDEHRSIEEQQELAHQRVEQQGLGQQEREQEQEQARQEGLEQGREQAGQLEQNIERRGEDERQEGVHEGRDQTHSLRLQEELPTSPREHSTSPREAHTLLEQLGSERPEQLLQQRPQQKQQQQQQRQRKQVQACLDFGQKDLLHTTCRVCGFVFAKGLKADEMAHDAHHRLFCGTVIIQKDLLHTTCRVCGFVFAKGLKADEMAHEAHHKLFCGTVTIQGLKADEAAHDAHHKLFCGTVTIQGWRNERVVHTVSESTRDTRNACSTGAGAAETAAGRIVLITHADCTAVQLAKVRYCALDSGAICALQCTVLRGSVGEGNGCESHVAAAGTFLTSFALPLCALSPYRTIQMQEIAAVLERGMGVSPTWLLGGQWKAYLYIRGRQLVGCLHLLCPCLLTLPVFPLTFPSHPLDWPPSFPLSPPPLPAEYITFACSLCPSCLSILPHHLASPSLTASSPTSFPPSRCLPHIPPTTASPSPMPARSHQPTPHFFSPLSTTPLFPLPSQLAHPWPLLLGVHSTAPSPSPMPALSRIDSSHFLPAPPFLVMSQFSIPPSHCLAIPPSHCLAIPPSHCLAIPPSHCLAIPPSHCLAIPPSHCLAIPPSHCLAIPPSHCLAIPPSHCLAIPIPPQHLLRLCLHARTDSDRILAANRVRQGLHCCA
ncbi:unnamed protein product [Closterium sp. NIES-65]|nr:unnamed protein product [Closterium sp. NIES-65]